MIGTTLGHYQIVGQLGAGGMGVVYRARDEQLGREVAIKVVPEELAGDAERLARFEREARVTGSLNHPNILTVYALGRHRGAPFLVTEMLEGESLREIIARGNLPVSKAKEYAEQIATGLSAAHTNGIVHRDLKPENIFVTTDSRLKILDFGLARLFLSDPSVTGELEAPTATLQTDEGAILGTLGYMSPEQLRGQSADHRADIFALGCVLYEMLTWTRPFAGPTPADTAAAVLREDPASVRVINPKVPPGLESIVMRCLEKRPDERFQSARDLAFALQAISDRPSSQTAAVRQDLQIRSIAVLPFASAETDDELEYLADGLTEGLIGRFSGVADIDRVIARHSVFRYKGADVDPAAVGRELGVDAVLVGDVATRGEVVIVRPELVGTDREDRIWGGRFSSEPDKVHQVEESISQGIIDALGVQLTRRERQQVERRYTDNPDAYRLYLRARHLWNKRTPEALERSIELYRGAINLDPQFALPHTGIADSLVSLYYEDMMTKSTVFRDALSAVLTALDLDDEIAESHMALGSVIGFLGYDWERSEQEYRRALELNPRNAEAFHQYAHVLSVTGRGDRAVEMMRRAHDLEPVSSIFNSCMGQVLYLARNYDEALRYCEAAVELEPTNPHPYAWHGMVHVQRGDHAAAEIAFNRGLETPALAARIRGAWGYSHAVRGDLDNALAQLDALAWLAKDTMVDPCYEAWILGALGDHQKALNKLEEAFAKDVTWVVYLKVDPFFDVVRGDPRYQALLKKLNFLES